MLLSITLVYVISIIITLFLITEGDIGCLFEMLWGMPLRYFPGFFLMLVFSPLILIVVIYNIITIAIYQYFKKEEKHEK